MVAFAVPSFNLQRAIQHRNCAERTCPRFTMQAMRFRPCIDLHDGHVKQIVGSTLSDNATTAPETNFDTELPSEYFAKLYAKDNLPGGHVIMLGGGNEEAAINALRAYPGGLHVGGGITPLNAAKYLDAGASHVIVTSYVFRNGVVDWDRVTEMSNAVGRARLVLDLSCRRRADGSYVVCTDRWKNQTQVVIDEANLMRFGSQCDELLVHAVDVEGKRAGMDETLLKLLSEFSGVPVTYAGGVRSVADLEEAKRITGGKVDVTVGSALDIFGGDMLYVDAVRWQREQEKLAIAL